MADYVSNNGPVEKLKEEGLNPTGPSPTNPVIPPMGGRWSAEHWYTFSAIAQYTSRTYRWLFDQALQDNVQNALAMENDPVIYTALNDRWRAVCQADWQIQPENENNPQEVASAERTTRLIEKIPRFLEFRESLLRSQFYGRYGVNCLPKWKWDYQSQQMVVGVENWKPVHGDKILFTFADEPAITVSSFAYDGEVVSTDRGPAHILTPDEQEWFIWHEFQPRDVDYWNNISALQVHGLGFRGILYYFWWLRNNLTQIMFDFLQKVGTGITIFFFEQGNEESYQAVKTAAENQIGNNVYLFPRSKDGSGAYGAGIQRVEVNLTGADFIRSIFEMLNDLMRAAILGEKATTESISTGLGSSVAEQHGYTADDRTKYDALSLEHPMQRLTNSLYRWNEGGVPPGRFKFLIDKRNPEEYTNAVETAINLGLDVSENELRDTLSLKKPKPGEGILTKLQALQPSSMASQSMTPEATPMAGQPGPQIQLPQQMRRRIRLRKS